MPALFIGHGSPMNTPERNGYTEAWRAFGRHLARPKAILAILAILASGNVVHNLGRQWNAPDLAYDRA